MNDHCCLGKYNGYCSRGVEIFLSNPAGSRGSSLPPLEQYPVRNHVSRGVRGSCHGWTWVTSAVAPCSSKARLKTLIWTEQERLYASSAQLGAYSRSTCLLSVNDTFLNLKKCDQQLFCYFRYMWVPLNPNKTIPSKIISNWAKFELGLALFKCAE